MIIDNLEDHRQEFADIKRRLRELETTSPLGFSSITRGQLRVASPEGLLVEGSARVSGVLDGDGTLHWTGTVKLDGPVSIVGTVTRSGNETATGTTALNGTTDLNGPTTITGQTTVQGDLDVTGGGTIQAGAVEISPASGGRVTVGDLTLTSDGTAQVGTRFRIAGGGIHVPNLDAVTVPDTKPANLHAVYWDSSDGRLYREL